MGAASTTKRDRCAANEIIELEESDMAWVICPRCELNYIQEGEKMCDVCRKEVRGEQEIEEIIEMCSECGEHPVVPGSEFCAFCLKEMNHHESSTDEDRDMMPSDANVVGIDSISSMEEIELDISDGEFDGQEMSDEDDDRDEDDDEI